MVNVDILKRVFSCIDNTSLNSTDTNESIRNFCDNTLLKHSKKLGIDKVASVCVFPVYVGLAHSILQNSSISVATVVGSFPYSMTPIEVKLSEVDYAISKGADELDMVINRGMFFDGDYKNVAREMEMVREKAEKRILKVILETGELKSIENIQHASKLAIESGADFIKTSTGKSSVGATIEAADAILQVIYNYYKNFNKLVGLKVSGRVSTIEDALVYANLAIKYFGVEYINKQYFRIGTSKLTDSLFQFLT